MVAILQCQHHQGILLISKLYLASVSAIVHLIVSQADHQTIPILHRRDLFIYLYFHSGEQSLEKESTFQMVDLYGHVNIL